MVPPCFIFFDVRLMDLPSMIGIARVIIVFNLIVTIIGIIGGCSPARAWAAWGVVAILARREFLLIIMAGRHESKGLADARCHVSHL